jgi:hypothetical protein
MSVPPKRVRSDSCSFRKPPIWTLQPNRLARPWREHWRAAKARFGSVKRGVVRAARRRFARWAPIMELSGGSPAAGSVSEGSSAPGEQVIVEGVEDTGVGRNRVAVQHQPRLTTLLRDRRCRIRCKVALRCRSLAFSARARCAPRISRQSCRVRPQIRVTPRKARFRPAPTLGPGGSHGRTDQTR